MRTIVFDVNETLLDLGVMRSPFADALGEDDALSQWFSRMLHLSLVVTLTGLNLDFGQVGRAALQAVADRAGTSLGPETTERLLGMLRELPAHPEVPAALARLRDAGFRTSALTNSSGVVALAQLAHAGLDGLLDPILSVDAVGHFKPAPEAYLMASDRLKVRPADLRLVAAHDWDVIGAMRAGWSAAFVARPGKTWAPLIDPPDVIGRDLDEVVDQILELDG